jgi:hypothetical protein
MTNNKQQTAMKLYTEEQVISMIDSMGQFTDEQIEYFVSELTPIRIPSDEEIGKEASVRHYGTNFKNVFASGAKWMRNKIQGNKE